MTFFGKMMIYPGYRRVVFSVSAAAIAFIMIWTIASVRVYNGTVAAELAAAGIAELDTLKTGVEQVVSDALISSNMLLSERHCYAVMYGNGINRLKEAELVYSIRSIIALAQTRTYLGVINGKIGRYVGTRGVYIGIEPSIAGRKKNLSFSSDVFVRDVKTGTSQSAETARVLTVLFQPVKMHNTSVEPSFVVTDIALANLWDNMAATIRENDIPVLLWNPQYGTLLAGKSAEKLDDSLCAQAADAAARSGTGYDIISYQGRNYLACGSALKYADLHVLSIQEYAGLVPRMAQIQRVILACAVVSMLLLLTAMFAFSKFTNPVRKLAMRLTGIRTPDDAIRGEILKLKHVLDDFTERHGKTPDKPLADGALRQAILGGPGAAPQAEALLAELGEGARGAARFCVLLFSIDEFRTNASYFDRTYYMYIISSMAREMLPVPLKLCYFGADRRGVDFAAVLMLDGPDIKQEIRMCTNELLDQIHRKYDIIVSASFGTAVENCLDLNESFLSAQRGLSRRLYDGRCSMMVAAESGAVSMKLAYPDDLEKKLIDAIMVGDQPATAELLDRLCAVLVNEADGGVFDKAERFLATLMARCAPIYDQRSVSMRNQMELLTEVKSAKSAAEIARLVRRACKNALEVMQIIHTGEGASASVKAVSTVCGYVSAHFDDSNLSVTALAEFVQLSPEYLGRIFYRQMGVTISDYMLSVRMRAASDYLLKTEHTVREISEMVGIANSTYFYKLFKKTYGVTPTNYRTNGSHPIESDRNGAAQDEGGKAI